MASLNKCFLIGNLTRDPENRSIANGSQVASFCLAVNRKYKQDGEMKEEVCFVDITVMIAMLSGKAKRVFINRLPNQPTSHHLTENKGGGSEG